MGRYAAGSAPINSTAGAATDPSTSAILAELDSTNFQSSRNGRIYAVDIWIGGSTSQVWQLEVASSPNVDSTSILERTTLRNGSGITHQYVKKFKLDGHQRIRLRQPTAVAGTYEAKLQAEEIV
jgi:oligoribonuclease NrnB/cAMP/cGMP phosphodiesterase (DHH superfamily)